MIALKILVSDTLGKQGLDILASRAELAYKPEISPEALLDELSASGFDHLTVPPYS